MFLLVVVVVFAAVAVDQVDARTRYPLASAQAEQAEREELEQERNDRDKCPHCAHNDGACFWLCKLKFNKNYATSI